MVLCSSFSPSASNHSTAAIRPGSYHFISISVISAFQLLSLPHPPADPQTLVLDPSSIDSAPLLQRLKTTRAKLAQAESRQGPPGTTRQAQDLFDALSRQYRMEWVAKSAAMILAEDYMIEHPYTVAQVKILPGAGTAQGLDRMRKVVQMERAKLELKWSAREIDVKMGKENQRSTAGALGPATTASSPRKGG